MLGKRGFVPENNNSGSSSANATTTTLATPRSHFTVNNSTAANGNSNVVTVNSHNGAAASVSAPYSQATQVVESQEIEDTTLDETAVVGADSTTRKRAQKHPWARLLALDANCKHVDLFLPAIRMGRKRDSQVTHHDIRISGSHCVLYAHAALVAAHPTASATPSSPPHHHHNATLVNVASTSTSLSAAAAADAAAAAAGNRVDGALEAAAYLYDMSTNGTYVNAARVGPVGKVAQPPWGDDLPTLEQLRSSDAMRPVKHGDRIALVKQANAADTQFTYLFEDLARNTIQELRQAELQAQYEVGNIIGTGAFSQVRICVDRRSGEQRCVKVVDKRKYGMQVSPQQQQQQQQRNKQPGSRSGSGGRVATPAQVAREIDILKRVKHPNIVNVCDVFESPRYIYLVLELARGGELFDRLYESGAMEEQRARNIFAQLLSATEYLHHHNIVHRDLKPENILFLNDHSDVVKVTDFGLARLVGHAELMQTLCGTPAYVAPEIIRAVQVRQAADTATTAPQQQGGDFVSPLQPGGYSKAVDMWSLGIILYALLSGAPPFDEEPMSSSIDDIAGGEGGGAVANQPQQREALSLFEQIARGVYRMPDSLFASVSEDAKDLTRRLLVVDPATRLTVEQALAHRWIVGDTAVSLSQHTQQTQDQANNQVFASPQPKRKRVRVPGVAPVVAPVTVAESPLTPDESNAPIAGSVANTSTAVPGTEVSSDCLALETPVKTDGGKRRRVGSDDQTGGDVQMAPVSQVVVPDTPPSTWQQPAASGSITQRDEIAASLRALHSAVVIGDSPMDAIGVSLSNAVLINDTTPITERRYNQRKTGAALESPSLPPPPVPGAAEMEENDRNDLTMTSASPVVCDSSPRTQQSTGVVQKLEF